MILFLDFDGVLHPQYDGEPTPADVVFCHLPRFELILRDYPAVDVVISSTWRHQFPIEYIKARFSPDIAGRILGGTPQLASPDEYAPDLREREILAWLAASGRTNEPWLALDDAVWQFKQHRSRVVGCVGYRGLDDAVELRLRSALTSS